MPPRASSARAWKRAKERSDTLLIFLLKARRPDIYRERFEHTAKFSGEIHAAMIDPASLKHMTTEEAKLAVRLFRKLLGEKVEEGPASSAGSVAV